MKKRVLAALLASATVLSVVGCSNTETSESGAANDGGNAGGDTTVSDGGNEGGTTEPEEPAGSEIGNGWTLMSVGDSNATGSMTEDGTLTLTANGKFESGNQKFGFVWRKIAGDFTATVRLKSYSSDKDGNQSAACLMLNVNPEASGTDMLYMTSGVTLSEYYSHYRLAVGNSGKKSGGARADAGEVMLRLARVGDKVTASYSTDGVTFTDVKSDTFAATLPEEVYVGLAVSSGNNTNTATATFADWVVEN